MWRILPAVVFIAGWVFEDNVVQFLVHVSRYIGYEYDDLDGAAPQVRWPEARSRCPARS
jgi:hypothetical protein